MKECGLQSIEFRLTECVEMEDRCWGSGDKSMYSVECRYEVCRSGRQMLGGDERGNTGIIYSLDLSPSKN